MPDYFVPIDTARNSILLRELNAFQITYKYTTQFIDANRTTFKKQYPTFADFNNKFVVTDKMMDDLIALYKKEMAGNAKLEVIEMDQDQKPKDSSEKESIVIDGATYKLSAEQIQSLNKLIGRDDDNFGENLPKDRISGDLAKSGSIIKAQIKAGIARDLFGDTAYYQVINSVIDAYSRAIEIISNEAIYNRLLGK